MINKDRELDISDKIAAKQFDELVRHEESAHDISLLEELVNDVNQVGYFIQYYFQLQAMSLEDRNLYPIISKYIGRFDNPDFSIALLGYIGVPRLYEATEFLISVFEQPNKKRFPEALLSTRQASSSSILRIKDKRYQNKYRELITATDTHNDSCFLVELLGNFICIENYLFLLELLHDECVAVRSHAVLALSKYKQFANEIIPTLQHMVEEDSSSAVREYAKRGIKNLSKYLL